MHYIDSAVQLLYKNGKPDIDAWTEQMERWKISHAVIVPAQEHVTVFNREGNEQIAKLVKTSPDRFSGLAVANPWYGKKALEILKQAFESGLRGLYLNPARQGFHLAEHIIDPLVKLCVKYGKPVYSHTGTPVFSMPFQLAELARRFPEARFVMGHAGWSDFWYDVIPAARQAENILVETSCTTGGMVLNFIDSLGADRVIYGSGYPQSLPERELNKILQLELAKDVLKKIMYGNASSLWGITL